MPRPEGAKNKPKPGDMQSEQPIKNLPNRPTLKIGEVAHYYGVTNRTVYLWIAHKHLETIRTPAGCQRVTRESFDRCRFAKAIIA